MLDTEELKQLLQNSSEFTQETEMLSDIDREGYIIADLYNPKDAKAYKVWNGAKYEIRDYLVTVNKNENKSLEVEVHGLLEQEN